MGIGRGSHNGQRWESPVPRDSCVRRGVHYPCGTDCLQEDGLGAVMNLDFGYILLDRGSLTRVHASLPWNIAPAKVASSIYRGPDSRHP